MLYKLCQQNERTKDVAFVGPGFEAPERYISSGSGGCR